MLSLSKIVWLWSQPGHLILGSDGENYLNSLDGLLSDGFFSGVTNLHYWPAGYPILMWPLAEISYTYFPFIVGVFQILFYSLATFYFAIQLQVSKFNNIFWPMVMILSLNPTLALNAALIGYEVNVATTFLFAIGAFLKFSVRKDKSLWSREIWFAAAVLAISTFMQPRVSILAFGFFVIWSIAHFRCGIAILMILTTSAVVAIGPIVMMSRNQVAHGFLAVSTNLGTTMNIGAGPAASGGYTSKSFGVTCPKSEGNAAIVDSSKVRCILDWYVENPRQASGLFLRKFTYHWSPWFGPLANGTAGRSPWFQKHPLRSFIKTEAGSEFVLGNPGKLISWGWIIGGLALMLSGTRALWRLKGHGQVFATLLFVPTILNAFTSLLTIGDHRFRIPTMTLSILLQLFGAYALFSKRNFKAWAHTELTPTWPGLNWKKKAEIDNLPS